MNEILEQSLLYDFYGELLNDHQKEVYEQFVLDDLSLSEIAQEKGISRQGVHDLIRRCDRILQDYENKLHLIERFAKAKQTVRQIQQLAEQDHGGQDVNATLRQISGLSNELLKEL